MDELPLIRRLDSLMDALEDAQEALAQRESDSSHALAAAYSAVASLAAGLDPVQHPEVAGHLQRLCDVCAARLHERSPIAIASAIALFAPIRASLEDVHQNVTYRPPASRKRLLEVAVPAPTPCAPRMS